MAAEKRAGFGWLHLTDLHVGIGADHHLWENHEEDILTDLRQLHADAGPWELMFFTGDLTQRGSTPELDAFDERLSRVMATIRELQDHQPVFLPVPGNHDLRRPNARGGPVAMARMMLTDREMREDFWSKGDSELRRAVDTAFESWTAWWAKRATSVLGYKSGLLPGEYSASLELAGLQIGVLGLNSAALHLADVEPGALTLDARQVKTACGAGSKPWTLRHDFCFLLTHHPPDWLDTAGRAALDDDIYPPETFVLHLFGHAHEGAFQTWTVGAGWERGRLLGRSLFGLEWLDAKQHQERLMGYLAGRCWLEGRQRRYQLWPRSARRIKGGGGWQVAADADHYRLVDAMATREMDLRVTPRRAASPRPSPASMAPPSPSVPAGPVVVQTAVHPFYPQSVTPFLDVCRGVRGVSTTAALFADRLLIALKARAELADLPYRIEALLLGKLEAEAERRLHRAWLEGVTQYAPGALPTVDEGAGPLQRLLAPVAARAPDLRRGLRGVITRPLPADVLSGGRLALMREERQRHLRHFHGRQSDLTTLGAYLEGGGAVDSRVVLVRAPEGFGKSAIISMLIENRRFADGGAGHDLTAVRRECDWLPGPLVLFGKAEKHPEAIVRLLLAQANAMLVQPVVLPAAEEGNSGLAWDVDLPREPDSDGARAPGLRDRHPAGQGPHRVRKDRDLALRSALNQALARLVEERGSAELVLDALDEISVDGSDLGFIPEVLPSGAAMLLATRPEEGIIRRLEGLRPLSFNLFGVDEATASALTGLPPGPELSKILNESQGSPLMMEYLGTSLQSGATPASLDLTHAARAVFSAQVERWRQEGMRRDDDIRYQMLILLAIMEAVGTLSLNAVQGFADHVGVNLSQAELLDLLEPVASHLDGLASGQLKLTTRKLAEFVWRKVLSRRDQMRWMERIVGWLGADDLVEVSLLMSFLKTWTDPAYEMDGAVRDVAGRLVSAVERAGKVERLYEIFDLWPKSDERRLPEAAVACLRSAATSGELRAMRRIGLRLLDGTGMAVAPEEGERWLRQAAIGNDRDAMAALGSRLLAGRGVSQNAEEGQQWLLKAAEAGSGVAMGDLGRRLLVGEGVSQNVEEGERWLRKAAEAGDGWSMGALGIRLLDGEGVGRNAEEGERWLRKAAEVGNAVAMRALGSRLLDGEGVTQNTEEGEHWLRKAAEVGNAVAMGALGIRLLDGEGVTQNTEEGEHWLRKAAEAGNAVAMRALGSRLLEGVGVPPNAEEGERWLRRAAEAGDSFAKMRLGYLIYERALGQVDPSEAHREAGLLFIGAWEKDHFAAINLAYMLRRGEIAVDGLDVVALLSERVDDGEPFALVNLALHIIRASSGREAWSHADVLMARAVTSERIAGVIEWWSKTAAYGDPEGPLVLALLWRHHHLSADPDQVAEWWNIAEAAGWSVPLEFRGRRAADQEVLTAT